MDSVGAFGVAVAFLEHLQGLPDHRQLGKVVYPLDEVLLLSQLGAPHHFARRKCGGAVTPPARR